MTTNVKIVEKWNRESGRELCNVCYKCEQALVKALDDNARKEIDEWLLNDNEGIEEIYKRLIIGTSGRAEKEKVKKQ